MTWNREEALRLAQILDASIGSVPAPVFAQARYDASRQLEAAVSEIDRLTAERDKLRSDYTGWSEYSTELADERDHWRRARDTAMEAGEVLRQQRDAVRTDFDNALEAWGKEVDAVTKERDEALARVKELEAELTAAWQATGVAGMVRGLTTLADVVGVHRAEMDTLRARIAVLEACIAATRAALTPDLIAAIKAAGVEEP